ncbi:universal stress protein [Agromyces protaetiae]|uniref:Universal stress protein n=1 Tax=Agromyces protaetiae TaxID=2509455 RepID=A0A4P6FDW5_9MICO|nr:universal stress protein [Agromyces protaetiae]QAY72569.1 universal stress protein [Agromyces protaetiae]
MPETPPTIVVGIAPHQPDAVVQHAAALAARLGANLVCASVDLTRYTVEEYTDGSTRSIPIDPDQADAGEASFDPALEAHLGHLLKATDVSWETRALAGDPARALAQLADTVDAMLIVVGTREPGLRGTLHEFFGGSVAAHLAHRQHRPILIVPLAPVGFEAALPWETES